MPLLRTQRPITIIRYEHHARGEQLIAFVLEPFTGTEMVINEVVPYFRRRFFLRFFSRRFSRLELRSLSCWVPAELSA